MPWRALRLAVLLAVFVRHRVADGLGPLRRSQRWRDRMLVVDLSC